MEEENNFTTPEKPEETTFEQKKKSAIGLSLILQLVTLAGLIVLYVLFFTSGKKAEDRTSTIPAFAKTSASRTVFVNLDTLNEHYEFVKALRTDLEATGTRLQNEILNEQKTFEKDAADFQQQVQANAMTEASAKTKYEALMMRQQALVEKKDRYTQQVAEKELQMHQTLIDTVTNFLKRYNKEFGYDYIMGYSKQGEILFANDTLDITQNVLKALNDSYSAQKKK
jgi:outer membrane protein